MAGFTLANGKHFMVATQFQKEGSALPPTPESQLLAVAHDGACNYFQGVLGPDYNAVHRDHFHLETGGYRMCR